MKPIHIIYSKKAFCWQGDKVALAFADCFEQLGFEVTVGHRMKNYDRSDTLFLVSVSAAEQVRGEWHGKICLHNTSEVYINTVGRRWFRRFKALGEKAGWINQRVDFIWDYAPQNGPAFKAQGFDRTFCPFAYHHSYDRPVGDPRYDVGFIGMVRPGSRRHGAIQFLERARLNVFAEPREKRLLTYDEITEGLHSRVFLHVHAGTLDRINYPSTRIIQLGAPCAIPCVVERTNWTPMEPDMYREFEINDHKGMLREIRWCLDNPEDAQAMANRALRFLKTNYQMLPFVARSCYESGLL